jgi:hypothetical protein
LRWRSQNLTRTQPNLPVAADGSGDFFLGSFLKDACNLNQYHGFGLSASDLALEGLLLGIRPSGEAPGGFAQFQKTSPNLSAGLQHGMTHKSGGH